MADGMELKHTKTGDLGITQMNHKLTIETHAPMGTVNSVQLSQAVSRYHVHCNGAGTRAETR